MVSVAEFLESNDWKTIKILEEKPREPKFYSYRDLELSDHAIKYLEEYDGIYLHQRKAIEKYLLGENVCLTTRTASGKSLVFFTSVIDQLSREPSSKIIAMYPLRALGEEQKVRLQKAIEKAGIKAKVGKIDGSVPISKRLSVLNESAVVVFTPDVIHAWLMYNLSNKIVLKFLSKVSLVILDEVHNYTGVFGSNCAFLFRRLRHVMNLLKSTPQWIAASATINSPEDHLKKLTGVDFEVVGSEYDTSPKKKVTIKFVTPPGNKDIFTSIGEFLKFIAKVDERKFIVFVDSRRQTEYLTSVVSRMQKKGKNTEVEDTSPSMSKDEIDFSYLEKLNILPYRAGYEEEDRKLIQKRLSEGKLSGIVSTSALELGIDVPHLEICILVGVPHSRTSFFQRIGRVGRHSDGEVIVVNTGDLHSANIFKKPEKIWELPLSEGSLYLQNSRIQYIHVLCLARHGGEHDQVLSVIRSKEYREYPFETTVDWPNNFVNLCKQERQGTISPELQSMKMQAGDDPNHVYPLRDVEVQFRVEFRRGPNIKYLGSLSYSQVMREAFPGAVYYYATKPYRVCRVKVHSRTIEVRPEKKYTTMPYIYSNVYPNLEKDHIYKYCKYGNLLAIECDLQIRECITGFRERRGPTELKVIYPLDPKYGFFFDHPRFTRNYFTTGVVITHTSFSNEKVDCEKIAEILFEAFLMTVAYERRDLGYAWDLFRITKPYVEEGKKFICIFDQTYGSLRLSGRLLEESELLENVFAKSFELAKMEDNELNIETLFAIEEVYNSVTSNLCLCEISREQEKSLIDESRVRIILPGSKGLNIRKDVNIVFNVEKVFYHPEFGLCYKGNNEGEGSIIIPVEFIKEVPGESLLGFYNLETGEIEEY